jgi:hypothetical protein
MRKDRDGRHQPTPEGGALILFYALLSIGIWESWAAHVRGVETIT